MRIEAGEIMDQQSICVMGSGACPTECPLVETGRKVFRKIPYGADLRKIQTELRRRVIFAEAYDRDVTVVDVARVMGACVKENPRLPNTPTPSAA